MSFIPYLPPNGGDGLSSVDRDLCWRINSQRLVTPAVIGAVCWALNHFSISDAQQTAVLNGLGLEFHRLRDGSTVLRPKERYRVALFGARAEVGKHQCNRAAQIFSLVSPVQPLTHYDAVEVYGCHQGIHGVERFEANEHAPTTTPHFWSVALHVESGPIETIADFPEESHARAFGEVMRGVLLSARIDAGRGTPHLTNDGKTSVQFHLEINHSGAAHDFYDFTAGSSGRIFSGLCGRDPLRLVAHLLCRSDQASNTMRDAKTGTVTSATCLKRLNPCKST